MADLVRPALDLVNLAAERDVAMRLLGGVAIRVKVPGWAGRATTQRPDIDFAIRGRDRSGVTGLMLSAGYLEDRRHNLLHGDQQLYFQHAGGDYSVDVIVDRLVMCHTLDLRNRLELDTPTLTSADLLLSKLQVFRLNEKDAMDMVALLSEYPLANGGPDGIDLDRVLAVTARDWGWWRTATQNLSRLSDFVTSQRATASPFLDQERLLSAQQRIALLQKSLVDAPKSVSWRLRAMVGDRVRWYEEPEEVERAGR